MMGELRHRTPAAAQDHKHHRDDGEGGGPPMPDDEHVTADTQMNAPPERRAGSTRSSSSRQKANDDAHFRAKCNACCCAPSRVQFHVPARAIVLTALVVVVGLQVLIIAVGVMVASTANRTDSGSSMYLMSMIPPSVSRSLQTVADAATSAAISLTSGGGVDARPFVVTDPNGLTVRSDWAKTSAAGEVLVVATLPFGSIVLLANLHRWTFPDWLSSSSPLSVSTPPQGTSTTTCMQMIYPYEGYVDVFEGNSVKPLVGTIDRQQQQQDPTRKEASEIHCCDSRSNSNGTDSSHKLNITWEDYRTGAYNAEGDSPQWTVQYQPPSTRGDDSALPTPPWMAPTWLDQVPIGSGRDGALVGSTASASVVPISTAALFVPPPVAAGKGKSSSTFGKTRRERKPDDGRLFAAAREALLRGDHGEANRLIGQLQAESSRENPFASLEYAADLIVAFAAHPLQFRQNDVNKNEKDAMMQMQRRLKRATAAERAADRIRRRKAAAAASVGDTHVGEDPSIRRQRDKSARGVLIENLISTVEARGANLTAANGMKDKLGQMSASPLHPLLERGQLDLQNGVYRESFVVAPYTQDFDALSTNNTRQHRSDRQLLHHREYFAALEEHIIASRFQCHELPSSSGTRDENRSGTSGLFSRRQIQAPNCLNMAIALSRSDAGKSSVSSIAWSELISANQTKFEEGSTNAPSNATDQNSTRQKISLLSPKEGSYLSRRKYMRGLIGVSVHSNSAATSEMVPGVEVCGVVTCRGDENMTMSVSEDGKVICSSSSSAEIFVAIELQSKGNDVQRDDGIVRSTDEMKVDCQTRLLLALEAGYDALRESHVNKFSQIMTEMDFRFVEKKEKEGRTLRTCDGSASAVEPSKNLSCKAKEENPYVTSTETGALLPSQLRQQFQFSRYLMLAAAASSVPNLQFWVDGPVSAWSGDYHLNVNLQMMYWGSGPAALRATQRPLGPFIKSLAEVGRNAAQRMYNSSGDAWVAHGNTDHSLGGDLRVDSFWVFCSTCGLWAALQLFESLLFASFDESQFTDILSALSVLRGAAQFLQQTTFVDPFTGMRHTGPTTSPENSYLVFRSASTLPVIRNVTSTSSKTVLVLQNNSTDVAGDSSNGTILVNKTIDVTTWELVATNQTFPATSWSQHLTFTPSFDASLIRQLANSFPLLVRWARDVLDESLYHASMQESDNSLASDLVKLARSLPNQANPIIGKSNTVLEYPSPMSSCGRHDELPHEVLSEEASPTCYTGNGGNDTTPLLVAESPDTGHRHFSGMHWLYPNTFLPLRNGKEVLDASVRTLDRKRKADGGHTGWSASWLAALSARLRDGNGAWTAISRLVLHYTTKNGLDLHPPLASLPKDSYATKNTIPIQPESCDTCFYEKDMRAQGSQFDASKGRGLETTRSDKFQLDGHGGLIAAVSELLLQSHIPGNLLVLPGLPSLQLSLDGGMVRRIKARGDVSVSVSWTGQKSSISVTSLEILFASRHPWLFGLGWDESDGYYSLSSEERKPMVRIYIPNDRTPEENFRLQASPCITQLDEPTFVATLGRTPSPLPPRLISGMAAIYLSIGTFPCTAEFK